MESLIDINIIKKNIREKIAKQDVHFTKEEFFIIELDPELMNLLKNFLESHFDVLEKLTPRELKSLLDLLDPIEYSTIFYLNCCKSLIEKGDISTDIDFSRLNEAEAKELEEFILTKLQDKSYQLKTIYISDKLFKLILKADRMDIISDETLVINLSDSSKLLVQEYFLKHDKKLNSAFYRYLKDLNLPASNLSLPGYIKNLEYHEIDDEKIQILLTKIDEYKEKLVGNFKWDAIYSALNPQQKLELTCKLLNIGYVDTYIIYLAINNENFEIIKAKYLDALKNDFEVEAKKEYIYFINPAYVRLLENPEIVESLILSGKILTASHSSLFKNFLPLVLDVINRNPEKYKKVSLSQFRELRSYPTILKKFIEIDNESINLLKTDSVEIKEYCKNLALAGNLENIPPLLLNDNDFLSQMVVNGHFDKVTSSKNAHKIENKIMLSEDACNYILKNCYNDVNYAVTFFHLHKTIIINNPPLLNYFLKSNDEFIDILLTNLNHVEEQLIDYTEEMFISVKDYFVRKYNFNERNLLKLKELYGPIIIRYLGNENIKKIINMSNEDFDKIMSLFPNLTVEMADVEKIYDSLKQYEFSKKKPEAISIFSNIMHSLDNIDEYSKYLKELINAMKDEFFTKFSKLYPEYVEELKINPEKFLFELVNKINTCEVTKRDHYINVLHTITDLYIAQQREEYRKTYDMNKELKMPYSLDEKDAVKQFIKHQAIKIHENLIMLEMTDLGIEEELARDCILYYAYDKRDFSEERTALIEKNIYLLIKIAKKIISKTGLNENLIEALDDDDMIRRHYYLEDVRNNSLFMLMELRLDVMIDTYLNDENKEIYNSLVNCINKYKLHLLPSCLNHLLESKYVFLTTNIADLVSFITYYQAIYEMEQRRLKILGKEENVSLSFTGIMKYAEAFSSVSSVYNQLLGVEDVRLIKANPNPNAATSKTQGNTRLKEAVEYTINNFKREFVTIPSFNEELSLTNGKKIRVVVGNFTHPSNITHGERTGSCMRIGGLGESLFKFCLEDENGFHIRFENPETGEFISRISGFRNGNTVYLNELRNSCNLEDYSDSLVVEACKQVAELLISKSKESSLPIENVFVHNAYATKNENMEIVSFEIENNKQGLKNFYTDIGESGIVLASTEKPFKKVNFDKSNIPKYRVAREVPYESYDNGKLRNMINRVNTMNKVLQGINYEYVEPIKFEDGLEYGIASQDWYVYVDLLGNVYYEYITNNDERILEELNDAKRKIEQYKLANAENFGNKMLISVDEVARSAG